MPGYSESQYPIEYGLVHTTIDTVPIFTADARHGVGAINLANADDFEHAVWLAGISCMTVTKIGLQVTAYSSVSATIVTFYRSNLLTTLAATETIGSVTIPAGTVTVGTVIVNDLARATTKTGVKLEPGEAVCMDVTTVAATSGRAVPFIEVYRSPFNPPYYKGAGTYSKTLANVTGSVIVVAV